jgi:type IV pilus assembly protein PilF
MSGWRYPILLLLLALAGCNTPQNRSEVDDQTGQAGRVSQPSDGRGDIYTNLAVSYLGQNRLAIALQEGKKAIAADPRNANAQNVMGLIYQRMGQHALAEKHFKQALAVDPHNFYALNAYGSFLCQQRRVGEAFLHFDNAVKNPLNPSKEVALANAGICAYSNNDREKAEGYLREALTANGRHVPALAQMVELSYDRGENQAAKEYLERYASAAPHTPATLWAGVRIERRLGNKKAEAQYAKLLRQQFPDSQQVQMLREMGSKG